jgi:hypothetical protein
MTARMGVPAGAEERRYVIHHAGPWPAVVHCDVIEPNGAERPLVHVMRHSPDGFEYGYGGSGPADLALSILVDFQFKAEFVATADRDASSFEIFGTAIAFWFAATRQEQARSETRPETAVATRTTTDARHLSSIRPRR